MRPLLLADDRPASVTHAYAAMKLLAQRAGLVVHDLLLGAADALAARRAHRDADSPTCADNFLGAVLRDWVAIDPAGDADRAARRPRCAAWCAEQLRLGARPTPRAGAALQPRRAAARDAAHRPSN